MSKVHPDEEKLAPGRVLAVSKLIRTMKSAVEAARTRRAEHLGWGLTSIEGDRGTPRPFGVAIVSALLVTVVSLYGVVKFALLIRRDVKKGVRCAACDFDPGRFIACGITLSLGSLFGALGLSYAILRSGEDPWTFFQQRNENDDPTIVHRLNRLTTCVGFEAVQFLTTSVVGIGSWLFAVYNLALLDVPGDPMHMIYLPFGHPNHTKRHHPWRQNNPLRIKGKRKKIFLWLEFYYVCAVALNAIFLAWKRCSSKKTMYRPKLWLLLDITDVGAVISCAYPRIFDSWGWYGSKFGGYSPLLLFGMFRFLRLLRLERLTFCLFAHDGLKLDFRFLKCDLNGVLIRYYLLLGKVVVGFFCASCLVCTFEYPCLPNAIRNATPLEMEICNPWFRRFDQCIYFLVVTMSTIGYGDMYPATRAGRTLVIMIVLFTLMIFPSLVAHIEELSDGDDTSDEDYIVSSIVSLWEESRYINFELRKIDRSLDKHLTPPQPTTKSPPPPRAASSPPQALASSTDVHAAVADLEHQVARLEDSDALEADLIHLVNDFVNTLVTFHRQ